MFPPLASDYNDSYAFPLMPLLLLPLLFFFFSKQAAAYPEFIGYKYSSCLTCHYNGHGNGPLNDYGRALWASEIAGRMFAGGRTEEQLGEASGFLGSKQLPWWIRPGFKARNLYYRQNPGGAQVNRWILMQAEVNAAIFFKQDQSFAFIGSFGHAPIPNRYASVSNGPEIEEWISREHYLRIQSGESMWWYIGMTDKVYGIRNVNHTAYSRARTGLAMNDQAHGVIGHYIQPTWEFTVNGFAGNLFQDADLRQMGGSTMFEYEYTEAGRVGLSALYSTNKYLGNQRFGVHVKRGYGFGSSLMFETGLIRDIPKGGDAKQGYYIYSEAMQKVVRGYHVFMAGQAYKERMVSNLSDRLKVSAGLLAFPAQRLEFRFEIENTRQFENSAGVKDETWALMGQAHVSL